MTNQPVIDLQAIPPAQWFYSIDNKQYGPVTAGQLQAMMRSGQAPPNMMVWREGFQHWIPAFTASELTGGPPPVPLGPEPLELRKVRNAKQNCIAMFVVFCVAVVTFLAGIVAPIGLACMAWVAPVSGLFAAIYVPVRWRIIKSLDGAYKWLGLVGGFGLIGLLLLFVVLVLFGLARIGFYARY